MTFRHFVEKLLTSEKFPKSEELLHKVPTFVTNHRVERGVVTEVVRCLRREFQRSETLPRKKFSESEKLFHKVLTSVTNHRAERGVVSEVVR